MSLSFILHLQSFKDGPDIFHLVQRLFINGCYQRFFPMDKTKKILQLYKGLVTTLICGYGLIEEFLYFLGELIFLKGFVISDILFKDVGKVAEVF